MGRQQRIDDFATGSRGAVRVGINDDFNAGHRLGEVIDVAGFHAVDDIVAADLGNPERYAVTENEKFASHLGNDE